MYFSFVGIVLVVTALFVQTSQAIKVTDECEISSLTQCTNFYHGWIHLPNSLGHRSQLEIVNSSEYRFLNELKAKLTARDSDGQVLQSNTTSLSVEEIKVCDVQIHQLACSILTPKCHFLNRITMTGLLPCRDVCREVYDRCSVICEMLDLDWPEFLSCEKLTEEQSRPKCRGRKVIIGSTPRLVTRDRPRKFPNIQFFHHNHSSLIKVFKRVLHACSDIVRVYTIGKSLKGRRMLVLEMSDNPGVHDLLEPEMKWIGGIHGNEVIGREQLITLVQFLCKGWLAGNERIQSMIRNSRIHIHPNMNPDGYNKAYKQKPGRRSWLRGRTTSRGLDLNRAFPRLNQKMYKNERNGGTNNHFPIPVNYLKKFKKKAHPELYSMISWISRYPFVLSAQLHGGDLVANYPYDVKRPSTSGGYTACPDDEVFRHLATTYAQNHLTMSSEETNRCDSNFGRNGGITNGADWYAVRGGMQDFNYLHTNCFEITIELGCDKFPSAKALPQEWENNLQAMLAFSEKTDMGIKGFVLNEENKGIANAAIKVEGIEHDIITTELGEYWRLLVPGVYNVTAIHSEYMQHNVRVKVLSANEPVRIDFILRKISTNFERKPKD